MPKPLSWITRLQSYWWLAVVVGGGLLGSIVLWGGLPKRVEKVEAGQAKQADEISDLKGWAREIQGYTRAQQQMNQRAIPAAPSRALQEELATPPITEFDAVEGVWWCCKTTTEACWRQRTWYRCSS